MAKSILVGKKPTNYEVEILDKPISKSKFSSALKPYNKVLVVTDDGLPKKYLRDINTIIGIVKKDTTVETTMVLAILLTTFFEEYTEPTK